MLLGLFALSANRSKIMLTQGILAGICVGLMEVPSIALIPDYFKKRLGLALGMAISGASAGGLIYSAVFRAILIRASFGWATRAIGFIVLATLGIAMLIIRPLDKARKSQSRKFFDLRAFKETPFLLTFLDAFLAYCAALVPYFITPAFAVSVSTSPCQTIRSSSSGTARCLLQHGQLPRCGAQRKPAPRSSYPCLAIGLSRRCKYAAFCTGTHWCARPTLDHGCHNGRLCGVPHLRRLHQRNGSNVAGHGNTLYLSFARDAGHADWDDLRISRTWDVDWQPSSTGSDCRYEQ